MAMVLYPFIHQWLLLFLPYQNMQLMCSLFEFIAQIRVYESLSARRRVTLLFLFWGLFSLQYGYLWWGLSTPMDRLALGGIVSLIIQTDTVYLCQIALTWMLVYFVYALCFTARVPFLRLCEDIFRHDRHGTLSGVAYGTLSEQTTARYICLAVCNLLNAFTLSIDALLLFAGRTVITTVIENPGEHFGSPRNSPLTFTLNVCLYILGTWTTVTSMALYTRICCTLGALGISFLLIFFRRLYHSETLLAGYRRKDRIFSWVPFRQYLVYSGQTFGMLFAAKDIFGRIFFAFLLVNMPMSAWALVYLSLDGKSASSDIALALMPAHELLICVLLHWAVAKFTKRLHAPSKTLLRLNASTSHRMGNFRARLLLHHTIVRLHTDAKYGFTYGSIGGLITMGSFGKCMLLYLELLMYAYTLIRGI